MDKQKLCQYTGAPEQLFGLRKVQLQEGGASGCTVVEATTAGGLQADVLADTCLDLGLVRYKGINVSFLTKNGYDSPARFAECEKRFINSFPAGLLYTCGLRSTGPPSDDGGEYHPQHGRVHGQPVMNLSTCVEDDELVIKGTIRETSAFGHMLELRRRISFPVWGSKIIIEDTIQNLTHRPEEFAVLYHFNFGFPLLSENARLVFPEDRKTLPRNDQAKPGLGHECEFDAPYDALDEMVFFHKLKEGWVKLINPDVNMAVSLRWNLDSLPILAQWKNLVKGDYVLGLEPSNNYIMGRVAERENKTLQTIEPFDTVKTSLELEFETI